MSESTLPSVASLELASLHSTSYEQLTAAAQALVNNRSEAEEIVQEAFARCLDAWTRRGVPASPAAYLHRSVVNVGRNRVRRRVVFRRLNLHPALHPPTELPTIESEQPLLDALSQLPGRQRECLVLRFVLDLPVAEVAEILGIGEGAVKAHTHRGLRALENMQEAE
ncbi:MAG: sigma-70 family RNA polymerase sigma factor [Acidimicrobiales bacterium]